MAASTLVTSKGAVIRTQPDGAHIVHVLHQFSKDSKLHSYLVENAGPAFTAEKRDYYLAVVGIALKRIIQKQELFDPENPAIIVCDQKLATALDCKAFIFSEMNDVLQTQMEPYYRLKADSDLRKHVMQKGILGLETFTIPEACNILEPELKEELQEPPAHRALTKILKFPCQRCNFKATLLQHCEYENRPNLLTFQFHNWGYRRCVREGINTPVTRQIWGRDTAMIYKLGEIAGQTPEAPPKKNFLVTQQLREYLKKKEQYENVTSVMPFLLIAKLCILHIAPFDFGYRVLKCDEGLKDVFGVSYIHKNQLITLIRSQLSEATPEQCRESCDEFRAKKRKL